MATQGLNLTECCKKCIKPFAKKISKSFGSCSWVRCSRGYSRNFARHEAQNSDYALFLWSFIPSNSDFSVKDHLVYCILVKPKGGRPKVRSLLTFVPPSYFFENSFFFNVICHFPLSWRLWTSSKTKMNYTICNRPWASVLFCGLEFWKWFCILTFHKLQ